MDQEKMNEYIQVETPVEQSEDYQQIEQCTRCVFSSLQKNDLFKPQKPLKKTYKNAAIIAAVSVFISLAVVAVGVITIMFSAKAQYFGAFEDIFERHFGDSENYEGFSEFADSFDNWNEEFFVDLSFETKDDKGNIKLNYNSTAGELVVSQDDNEIKVYADEDNIVLTDKKDPAYSLSMAPIEAYTSAQQNQILKDYKTLFEVSPEHRAEAMEELSDIISANLPGGFFDKCKTVHDGKEYDAVRFYTSEAETANMIASVLEDIDQSDNEYLRNETAWFLVNTMSVTKGADVSATIKNAIDLVVDTSCTVESIVGFEAGAPVIFSLDINFGDNKFLVEYTFIRKGNTANVGFGIMLDNGTHKNALTYEGTRKFESNTQTDNGTLTVGINNMQQNLVMSGEMSAVYKNEALTSLNIAVSSEDLNERFGITLSLTDNFSLSYTSMTQGYGNAAVITAERQKSEGKFILKNGRITVNEIASDELLAYNNIDASQLGSANYTFAVDMAYDEDNLNGIIELLSADGTTVKVNVDVTGESGFFASLFKDNIIQSETITFKIDAEMTADSETEKVTFIGSITRDDIPEIIKMEGGESLNGTDQMLDTEKTKQMIMHFMDTRRKSEVIDMFWTEYVVPTAYELTSTELVDINSAVVDLSVYDKIAPGTTDKAGVEALFQNVSPITGDNYYQYCSSDYKSDNSAGSIIYAEFDENDKVSVKVYIDYNATSKVDTLEGLDISSVKKGMTKADMLKVFGEKNPVMLESTVQNGVLYEYYYYGVAEDKNVVIAIELKDGVISRTA